MSLATLRQLLLEKLGEKDARRFQDVHLQNLLDKAYTDEGALQDATRSGLQTQPALPAALVDKLLKAFGQSGDKVVLGTACIVNANPLWHVCAYAFFICCLTSLLYESIAIRFQFRLVQHQVTLGPHYAYLIGRV